MVKTHKPVPAPVMGYATEHRLGCIECGEDIHLVYPARRLSGSVMDVVYGIPFYRHTKKKIK